MCWRCEGSRRAFARLSATEAPVAQAMTAHPELVGGARLRRHLLMRAVPGLMAKDGAEGVMAMALPDGRAVALKIADGSALAASGS